MATYQVIIDNANTNKPTLVVTIPQTKTKPEDQILQFLLDQNSDNTLTIAKTVDSTTGVTTVKLT